MIKFSKMNYNIQILLAITAAATSSYLQNPSHQLESTINSTLLNTDEQLFKPIIIPNITKPFETPNKTHKADENILKSVLLSEDSSQESTDEESKIIGNQLKFSSRYSTKHDSSKERITENVGTTEIPTEAESSKNEEIPKIVKNQLNGLDDEENKKDNYEQTEESESTSESANFISHRKYLERDAEENSTTEDVESSEEKEETEDKTPLDDYYNSGSKNYHSIQTPLDRIKYQGPQSFGGDRKRIISPIVRRPPTHNWPYSKSQIKSELENSNELPESGEKYEKELDEEIREEVKISAKQQELESAEEKDRNKFDRSKKYNYIELRNQRKQQQKALKTEEEKDDRKPLLQTLRQYQVDEEEQTHHPIENSFSNFKNNKKTWSTKHLPNTTPKANIRTSSKIYSGTGHYQGHQFLGPVVFSHHSDLRKNKPEKESTRNVFQKGLIENEKLDQENLTNEKLEKSVIRTENQSFNHLKESDEMYNAILANIQSVFGLRIKPLKSGKRIQKGTEPEVNLDESKAFTWSLPLIKVN